MGWFVYVHDLGGIGHTVGTLPLVELSTINRSHPIWAFAVCGLAAFGFDALRRAGAGRRRLAAAVGVAAGGTLVLAGAVLLARHTLDADGRPGGHGGRPDRPGRRSTTTCGSSPYSFLAGVAVLGGAGGGRRPAAVAAGGRPAWRWWAWSSPSPAGCSATTTRPSTTDLVYARLARPRRGDRRRRPGRGDGVAGRAPRRPTPTSGTASARPTATTGWASTATSSSRRDLAALPAPLAGSRMLEVLGIRYVAAEHGRLPHRPAGGPAARRRRRSPPPSTACTPSPSAPAEPAAGRRADCQVTVELVDTGVGARSAGRSTAPCRKPYTTLSFPPIADSVGHTYRPRSAARPQVLAFAPWAQGTSGLEQVDGNDKVALFRAPASPARYFSPPEARPVASDDEARRLLVDPAFSMARTVLVHDAATCRPRRAPPGRSRCWSNGRPRCGSG